MPGNIERAPHFLTDGACDSQGTSGVHPRVFDEYVNAILVSQMGSQNRRVLPRFRGLWKEIRGTTSCFLQEKKRARKIPRLPVRTTQVGAVRRW